MPRRPRAGRRADDRSGQTGVGIGGHLRAHLVRELPGERDAAREGVRPPVRREVRIQQRNATAAVPGDRRQGGPSGGRRPGDPGVAVLAEQGPAVAAPSVRAGPGRCGAPKLRLVPADPQGGPRTPERPSPSRSGTRRPLRRGASGRSARAERTGDQTERARRDRSRGGDPPGAGAGGRGSSDTAVRPLPARRGGSGPPHLVSGPGPSRSARAFVCRVARAAAGSSGHGCFG